MKKLVFVFSALVITLGSVNQSSWAESKQNESININNLKAQSFIFNQLTYHFINSLYSMEERQIIVDVVDENSSVTASAVVVVYTLDAPAEELGPYTVYEGTPLRVDIDERTWDVRVNSSTPGSTVTWSIE